MLRAKMPGSLFLPLQQVWLQGKAGEGFYDQRLAQPHLMSCDLTHYYGLNQQCYPPSSFIC